jgi:pilus assembly protein CpaF
MQELFGFRQEGVDEQGLARGSFYAAGNVPKFARRLDELGIALSREAFAARTLTNK